MKIAFLDWPDASAHCPISDRVQNNMMYYLPWQQSNGDCKIIPKTMSAGFNYEFLYFSLMLFFLALIIVTADSIIAQKKSSVFLQTSLSSYCWILVSSGKTRISVSP